MPCILVEEKKQYYFDCKNAVWATDEIHEIYHACGLPEVLSDVDFIIETTEHILMVEYKNSNIPDARIHANTTKEYDPFQSEKFNKIVSKFYDSLHYLRLMGKDKPIHYIFVLEYPKGNASSRRQLRNRLKKRLPFGLQERVGTGNKLIESVSVMSIEEWNADAMYGKYPILQMMQSSENNGN